MLLLWLLGFLHFGLLRLDLFLILRHLLLLHLLQESASNGITMLLLCGVQLGPGIADLFAKPRQPLLSLFKRFGHTVQTLPCHQFPRQF